MSKTTGYTLLAIVVVIIIVWIAVDYHKSSAPLSSLYPTASSTTTTTSTTGGTTGQSPTFRQLLTSTGERCTIVSADEAGGPNGTVYLANGEMRADMTTKNNTVSVTSHVLMTSNYVYNWA